MNKVTDYLATIVWRALDMGFDNAAIKRASDPLGEHVLVVSFEKNPAVTGVVTIPARLLLQAGADLIETLVDAMTSTLLPAMRAAVFPSAPRVGEAYFEYCARAGCRSDPGIWTGTVWSSWTPVALGDPWDIDFLPGHFGDLSGFFSRMLDQAETMIAKTLAGPIPWDSFTLPRFAPGTFDPLPLDQILQAAPAPIRLPSPVVNKVRVDVDVDEALDDLQDLVNMLGRVRCAYDAASEAAERFDEATEPSPKEEEKAEREEADIALLANVLSRGTDHQRSTFEAFKAGGVPIREIAASFRAAFG